MEGNISRVVRLGAGLLGVVTLGWILTGQAAQPILEGLPTDWTHRHVIFSQPATAEEAARMAGDPRYWQQWYRQNVVRVLSSDAAASPDATTWGIRRTARRASSQIHADWSQALGTLGAGNFAAKYSFGITTANCGNAIAPAAPDFVVFSTGLTGAANQASVIAFDNLYSGCTPPVPSTYWAYNTGGQILTSPVFSRDGSQIAFVQTSGGVASLVVLKWSASTGTLGSPATPTVMTTIALKSGTGTATADTTSSVFNDYVSDTAWVGDGSGWLHKFHPVFTAAPVEIRTAPWPVQVSTTTHPALSSPVFDGVSENVFVEDQGGYLYSVVASGVSAGTITKSVQVDFGPSTAALVSGPILDKIAEEVYAFSSNDGSTNCAAGTAPCSAVYKFPATFTAATIPAEITVGTSSATANPLYDGAFDNEFYSSPTRTGNLYVCGNTGLNPRLYQVQMLAGAFHLSGEVAPLTPAADHVACSPVSDILNPTASAGAPEERVFFGVTNFAHPTACTPHGCAQSFVSMPWLSKTTYTVGQEILIYRPANGALDVNVAIVAGTSGTNVPAWPNAAGTATVDGSVSWLNQGVAQFTVMAGWAANHAYALHNRILDSNGNVEVVTTPGTSGGTAPTNWATTAGGTTVDPVLPSPPAVTWTNAGPLPSAALLATGGTSGIIIDNTVSTGTLAGASELYFTPLANENCPIAPASGCAVQASQLALK